MKKERNIKNFLIYPKFQLLLVGVNCLLLGGSYLLVYFCIVIGFGSLKQVGIDANISSAHPFFKYLDYQEMHITQYLLLALGASFILITFFLIIFSHKIVGPVNRLSTDLRRSIDGEEVKFDFREGDFFPEIPELIGKLIKTK